MIAQIEVGQVYRHRSGMCVKIMSDDDARFCYGWTAQKSYSGEWSHHEERCIHIEQRPFLIAKSMLIEKMT